MSYNGQVLSTDFLEAVRSDVESHLDSGGLTAGSVSERLGVDVTVVRLALQALPQYRVIRGRFGGIHRASYQTKKETVALTAASEADGSETSGS